MNTFLFKISKSGINFGRFLCLLSLLITSANLYARAFTYEYEGQSIVYTVIDEDAKTCCTSPGFAGYINYDNNVKGSLILPMNPKDGEEEFTLTGIGYYSFSKCQGVTSIIIPNSVTTIAKGAFSECTGLISVEIPGSVVSIDEHAFSGCNSLKKADFSSLEHLLSIQFNYAFSNPLYYSHQLYIGGEEITKVVIPDNLTSIGDYTFIGCSGITSLEIPNSVTSIGDSSFSGCSGLISLSIPNSVTSIGGSSFSGCSGITSLDIPNSITSIGGSSFSGCESLTSVNLPNTLTEISGGLFSLCKNLTSIEIPETVTSIGYGAFRGCEALTSVVIPNEVKTIGSSAFENCINMESVTIGSSVTSIKPSAFEGCVGLKKADFASIESMCRMDYDIFWGNGKHSANPLYYAHNLYINGQEIKHLVIPESVKIISDMAFIGCSGLDSIDFPETLKRIGLYAFSECTGLTSITLPNSVETIESDAFKNCTGLASIDIPSSVTSIEYEVFYGCDGLTYIDLPESVTTIKESAFANCKGLTTAIIPSSVKEIGHCAFRDCSALTTVSIGSCVSPGWNVFLDCENLTSICFLSSEPSNFDELCFSNYDATIYVPRFYSDKYKNPNYIWRLFKEIKAMGDLTLSLSDKNLSLICGDTATIYPNITKDDDVNITSQKWISSDKSIATIDSGFISAVGEGEVYITLQIQDQYGRKHLKECKVIVNPRIFVEAITIREALKSLKKKRTSKLSADVNPYNATDRTIIWSSSDESIATIDADGTINTIGVGTVTFTAAATDGSGVSASIEIAVLPPTKGDSNDDDELLIDDAVRTANYAIGIESSDFCFEAADVNADGNITIGDASGTITEILNQPALRSSTGMQRAIAFDDDDMSDRLIFGDLTFESSDKASIDIYLDNSIEYVALQADIFVAEGMRIIDVEAGKRTAMSHSLIQQRIDEDTLRIIIFNFGNAAFTDTDAPILKLFVEIADKNSGCIEMSNIHASDRAATKYDLRPNLYHSLEASGVGCFVSESKSTVSAVSGGVAISNANEEDVIILTLDGICIDRFKVNGNSVFRQLEKGMYVISVGKQTAKITIR